MPRIRISSTISYFSYAHADTAWARWLHARLEGFAIDKDLARRVAVAFEAQAAEKAYGYPGEEP